jgi:hypothetical protein
MISVDKSAPDLWFLVTASTEPGLCELQQIPPLCCISDNNTSTTRLQLYRLPSVCCIIICDGTGKIIEWTPQRHGSGPHVCWLNPTAADVGSDSLIELKGVNQN